MNKVQLDYALKLQKVGNYSRAAKQLGISQPALSLQIKNLENELGIYLFDRTKKPIGVTYEGKRFLEKAEQLLSQFIQLESFAQGLKNDYAGEITVGIIPTLSPYMVPLFIGELRKNFPQMIINIKEMLTEKIIENLRSNTIQLGIAATPIETTTKFELKPIMYEEFMVFISDEHDLSSHDNIQIEDLQHRDIWLLKEGNCFRDQVNNICGFNRKYGSENKFSYESNSIEALCRIVENQGGITFIPELSTMHLPEHKLDMIKKIKGKKRVREISMITIPNQTKIRFVNKIFETIQKNIPKSMLYKSDSKIVAI